MIALRNQLGEPFGEPIKYPSGELYHIKIWKLNGFSNVFANDIFISMNSFKNQSNSYSKVVTLSYFIMIKMCPSVL